LESEAVGLLRFEREGTATLVAQSQTPWDPPPLGTSFTLDGENVVTQVAQTGQTARADDWAGSTGSVAAMASVLGVRSAVASPVVVEGRLWGTIIAATSQSEPLPAEAESRLAQFTELVATAIANAEARGELSRLAEEQAALRRVAVLVAQQPSPDEVFTVVTESVGPLLGADLAAMHAFRDNGAATVVASWSEAGPTLPVGTQLPMDGDSAVARIFHTRAAARIDSYADAEGETAEVARGLHLRSAVGAPILVEGRLWGALMAATRGDELLPPDAEARIAAFTELVATAVSNAHARAEVTTLAEEQAALRRVATLVAHDAPPAKVFEAVAAEVGELLDANVTVVGRYDGDGAATAIGSWSSEPEAMPVGTRASIGGRNVLSVVADTGRPARLDDYEQGTGEAAEIARRYGWRSSIAAPITVEDRVWGVMLVARQGEQPFPAGDEERLAQFTDLVATAVANAQAHVAVQTAADEQGALRRVATLVAASAARPDVFAAVTKEIALVLGADATLLVRADPDGAAVVVGTSGDNTPALGTRIPRGGTNLTTIVLDTGHSARIESYDDATGDASQVARSQGLRSAVGAPIVVEGHLWGLVIAGMTGEEPLAPDAQERLAGFTELVVTAISNAQAQGDLTTLAEQQAALRRVATLVARRVPPEAAFRAVAEEAGALLGADLAGVVHFESNETVTVMAGPAPGPYAPGERVTIDPGFVVYAVRETGRPARFETDDPAKEGMPELVRRLGIRSAVASPIVVEEALWGAVVIASFGASFPPETEQRLDEFTELVATGISNATARAELLASRARIVAASDETRRRIERNLHDGTQQRLVSLGLAVRAAEADIPPDRSDLRAQLSGVATGLVAAVEDLQEISRGIHPAILAKGGLGPALGALAHRSPIPVNLETTVDARLAEAIEVAAYYVVSEALANAAKHSEASRIDVSLAECDGRLVLAVGDDGLGGADSSRGSGLIGLTDRVEALGGSISVHSAEGSGTQIAVTLPLELESSQPTVSTHPKIPVSGDVQARRMADP